MVVDAEDLGQAGLGLELVIVAGPHKGEVVALRAEGLGVDEIEALGLPVTIDVLDGSPSITLDR